MPKGVPKGLAKIAHHAGRQRIPINWDEVDLMLAAGCSGVQVAACVGIHPVTLYNKVEKEKGVSFTDYAYEKCCKGEANIHVKQYRKALTGKGDTTLLIHLGKNRLKQSDKLEQKIEQEITQKRILELPDDGNM